MDTDAPLFIQLRVPPKPEPGRPVLPVKRSHKPTAGKQELLENFTPAVNTDTACRNLVVGTKHEETFFLTRRGKEKMETGEQFIHTYVSWRK